MLSDELLVEPSHAVRTLDCLSLIRNSLNNQAVEHRARFVLPASSIWSLGLTPIEPVAQRALIHSELAGGSADAPSLRQ
jgi:hypothetical protein